ncbi:hypothetical protein [Myxococcus qinghaiensis]|uniref:hypothetical protein n=1 Tax=Myxococcus qinghaiensis TaxID=2906758 RepID=UPI0020A79628|nr:hypothetical protein [Myxococcus qinghaiensis]MCP3167888.1 hypothetical protein [Myxococcus qinghaiensis]
MKTNSRWMALSGMFLALTLSACDANSGTDPVDVPEGDRFELRLLGQDTELYEKVLLGVGRIEVMAQGKSLPFQLAPSARSMDLSKTDQAYLLGYFYLPAEADTADVRVHFDDVGAFREAGAPGLINARSGSILFTTRRAELEKRKHVVIQLHLKDSLFQGRGSKVLLPSTFIVH